MRAHHGGIQKHDGQVDTLEPLQQLQDLPPDPTLDPALPAHVDRVPRAVGVWQIPPRRARAQNMQHTFQRLAVLDRRRTPPATPFEWQ